MDEDNEKPPANQSTRQVADFTESVFYRPGMYTINGTLEEVAAFLEGYYSAAAKCIHSEGAQKEVNRWCDFTRWLAEKVEGAESPSWSNVFRALRRNYSEDAAVFDKLREWYPEYLESRYSK